MARLRDVPLVVRKLGPWPFLKNLYNEINNDNLFTWAAAMAYSWLFAIFPFFLVLLTLIPYLPDKHKDFARAQIRTTVVDVLAREAEEKVLEWLEPHLDQILHQRPTGLFSIGLIVTIWAASGGMAMTMAALDKCYDVPRSRPYYKQRPLAIVLTIVAALLILSVIILIPIGSLLTSLFLKYAPLEVLNTPLLVAWEISRYALAFVLMFTALAVVYYYGANHDRPFHFLTPGSVFSVTVWLLLGVLFSLYVERYGRYSEMYGTMGGVVILLLFFYLDSLVLLVGAEINSLVDKVVSQVTGQIEPPAETLLEAAGVAPAPSGQMQIEENEPRSREDTKQD